jgi:hypothetical protein
VVEGINVAKARRLGLTGAEPTGPWPLVVQDGELPTLAMPDPGFVGAPDFGELGEIASGRLAEALAAATEAAEAAGDAASPEQRDLLESLLALLSALGLTGLDRLSDLIARIRRFLGR